MSERIELTKSDLIQQEKAMEEVRKLLLDRYPTRQPLAFTHSYGKIFLMVKKFVECWQKWDMVLPIRNQKLIASSLIPVQSERTRNFVFMAM